MRHGYFRQAYYKMQRKLLRIKGTCSLVWVVMGSHGKYVIQAEGKFFLSVRTHAQVEQQTSDMFEKMQGQLSHLESELSHSRATREKESRERARERREERERGEREREALKQQYEEQVEEMVREHQRERDRLQRSLEEKRVRQIHYQYSSSMYCSKG